MLRADVSILELLDCGRTRNESDGLKLLPGTILPFSMVGLHVAPQHARYLPYQTAPRPDRVAFGHRFLDLQVASMSTLTMYRRKRGHDRAAKRGISLQFPLFLLHRVVASLVRTTEFIKARIILFPAICKSCDM